MDQIGDDLPATEESDLAGFMIAEAEPETESIPQYEPPEVTCSRVADRLGRTIEVLVTVKTTPQPSQKYTDTVCVAGLAFDPLRWVRLYPIRFRHLDNENQFKKYELIKVPVSHSASDNRIESLKVDADKISRGKVISANNGWLDRARLIEPIGLTTLCELRAAVSKDIDAPSLGMIEPRDGTFKVIVREGKGWTPKQLEKLEAEWQQEMLELKMRGAKRPPVLEARALDIWLKFECKFEGCKGHEIGFLDWEATTAMRREQLNGREAVERILRQRFEINPQKPGKRLRIFVGNQSDPAKRTSFEALGLYYPDQTAISESNLPTLF